MHTNLFKNKKKYRYIHLKLTLVFVNGIPGSSELFLYQNLKNHLDFGISITYFAPHRSNSGTGS
jgi:hypothetical protein